MTPLEIEILLHSYYSTEPFPRIGAPAVDLAIKSMQTNSLIVASALGENVYNATARGKAHVSQLCNTKWPTKKELWIDEHGQIIDMD